MATRYLQAMGLDPEQVRATADFLQAYARTCLAELEEAVHRQAGPRDLALQQDPAFTIAADAATALREAGQWLLYSDLAGSRGLLQRAGDLLLELRQPFGAYLMAVAAADPGESSYRDMLRAMRDGRSDDETGRDDWPALRYPQQQAYLMLAVTGGAAAEPLASSAAATLSPSPHQTGVAPVGALGTPIRRLWDTAAHLLAREPESAQVIGDHLADMARRYAETMSLAQVNKYLWRHAAAPVDVGDIDVAGVASLFARRFGAETVLRSVQEAGLSAERNPIAMAPIEAGVALSLS
ncbi:hypothetical protein [Paractinoplanes rishiriensis]|uniref:Uncharacterized protein n=1 Tax=Paractinoplanes rishiriensis TaxID=1050105 RepID=A0A919K1S8_9ACTN|nr:hypothetical protein [Actinoplanes rishiriensis]GIE97652.1 hypothetical protein Ari01nite_51170 [Actinoplanes rishiriensis]